MVINKHKQEIIDKMKSGWILLETNEGYKLRKFTGWNQGKEVFVYIPVANRWVAELMRQGILEYCNPEDFSNPYVRLLI